MAAIRTYYQCEACDFGSFELKDIELHMQEVHTVDIPIETEKVELQGGNLQLLAKCSDESDSEPSEIVWSTGAIKLLIALVREDYEKFSCASLTPKHYLWKRISWKMAEKGYNYTHVRCDNKWRSLKKTYRHAKHINRSTKDTRKWKFYELMDEFLQNEVEEEEEVVGNGEDHNGIEVEASGAQTLATATGSSCLQTPVVAKKRRRGTTTTTEERERDRERRHREKMEQMNRFNDLFEQFVRNNKLRNTT